MSKSDSLASMSRKCNCSRAPDSVPAPRRSENMNPNQQENYQSTSTNFASNLESCCQKVLDQAVWQLESSGYEDRYKMS